MLASITLSSVAQNVLFEVSIAYGAHNVKPSLIACSDGRLLVRLFSKVLPDFFHHSPDLFGICFMYQAPAINRKI